MVNFFKKMFFKPTSPALGSILTNGDTLQEQIDLAVQGQAGTKTLGAFAGATINPNAYANATETALARTIPAPVTETGIQAITKTSAGLSEYAPESTNMFQKVGNNGYAPSIMFGGLAIGLAGISSLFSTFSNRRLYSLFKEQESLVLQNADIQAKRLQRKGNIALSDLTAKHALAEGKNELAAASSGAGSMSGSILDKLVANEKYDSRETFAQDLDTIWAVSNARRQGYLQAYQVAGQALNMAYQERSNAINNFVNGLGKAASIIGEDYKSKQKMETLTRQDDLKFARDLYLATFKYKRPTGLELESTFDSPYINSSAIGGFTDINLTSNRNAITDAMLQATGSGELGLLNLE